MENHVWNENLLRIDQYLSVWGIICICLCGHWPDNRWKINIYRSHELRKLVPTEGE